MYSVIDGDTFEIISRKQYGTEVESNRIAQANPGVIEPLTAGISLIIPVLPSAPQNIQQQTVSNDIDETAILINGKRFRFWESVRINRSIDSMDTIQFTAPFDADAPGFRETFRPFSYKPVTITVGGLPLFTGTMLAPPPLVGKDRKIISVPAYSSPGVLNDCMAPASLFPLEFNGQGLQEIATTLSAPFGVSVKFEADQGAIFQRVAIEPDKKILSFLIDLAKQRNLIISSTSRGSLLFQQSTTVGNPVARLQQGVAPVLSVNPFFNPQEYYSHLTGVEDIAIGLTGSNFTVKNSQLLNVVRPFTFSVKDTNGGDVKQVVEAKSGRMFGNAAIYTIDVATWRDPSGNLWESNTTITLQAPDAMIYNEYEFLIKSVEFNRERASTSAVLTLVLPGSFSGEIPESLPWDD